MPWPTKTAITLLLFLSLGAIAGGCAILRDTSGAVLKMTPRDLAGSPFSDFLIPGLFLLVALGFGSALAAFLLWKRPGRISRLFALGLSASLIAWIAVQVAVVGYRGWLQPLYAALGVSLIALLTKSTD